MKHSRTTATRLTVAALTFVWTAAACAQDNLRMTTPLPLQILTPSTAETRLGKLEFIDGVPTPQTAQMVYDNLDFQRGVEAFLSGIPGASLVAMRTALRKLGPDNGTIAIFETLMDSKSLFLTA